MNRELTKKLIDELIRFGAFGVALSAAVVAPNIMQALDGPLRKLFDRLDAREKEREIQRVIRYMKQQGLLAGSYEHGLQLTEKARKRLAKADFESLRVEPQITWDKRWRIIIYDIPEDHKSARNALAGRLRSFGCFQLQKSTWITPFPCRDGVATLAAHYDVDENITYFEAINLDNEKVLKKRFQKKYPATQF